jgi:hypothetical protein
MAMGVTPTETLGRSGPRRRAVTRDSRIGGKAPTPAKAAGAFQPQAGRKLREFLEARADLSDVEPLVEQLTAISDQLEVLRRNFAGTTDLLGLARLSGIENRLLTAFCRLWRMAGLDRLQPMGSDDASRLFDALTATDADLEGA